MDPLVRKGLRPRRLFGAVILGLVVGIALAVIVGDAGAPVVVWVCVALAVVAMLGWLALVLYLRFDRASRAVEKYVARRDPERESDRPE